MHIRQTRVRVCPRCEVRARYLCDLWSYLSDRSSESSILELRAKPGDCIGANRLCCQHAISVRATLAPVGSWEQVRTGANSPRTSGHRGAHADVIEHDVDFQSDGTAPPTLFAPTIW